MPDILYWFDFCRDGKVDDAKLMLEHGADPNVSEGDYGIDDFKWTGLHWAAEKGHLNIVNLLIQYNADIHALDSHGDTALDTAARSGHVGIVKVLIQNGADVNAVDKNKSTALHGAAGEGHVDVVKVLIQNGADVNAVDKEKWTALHNAAMRGHVDIVKALIQNGADVNVVTISKRTALDQAAYEYNGHVAVVKVLLENGADVNAVTKGEQTALHYAAKRGHVDIVKALIQNGADVNVVNKDKQSPLYTAFFWKKLACTLQLICCGAKIDKMTIGKEKNDPQHEKPILSPINTRLEFLRSGKRIGSSLMSTEERQYMWNLAFFFTWKYRVAAFKAYYKVRSFVTYNGIFMGHGYDHGEKSIWRTNLWRKTKKTEI